MTTPSERHRAEDPLPLPYVTPNRILIPDVSMDCPRCHGALEDIRGRLNDTGRCVDIFAAGICPACGQVVPIRWRFYYRENRVMSYENGCWLTETVVPLDQAKAGSPSLGLKRFFRFMSRILSGVVEFVDDGPESVRNVGKSAGFAPMLWNVIYVVILILKR
jgi:hypothetical protein